MKLLTAAKLINKTLSPLMIFSCGLWFAMFCIYIFTLFMFPIGFWSTNTWFAIGNAMLNMQMFAFMFAVLWICEGVVKEGKEALRLLFSVLSASDEKDEKVKIMMTEKLL